MEKLLDKQQFDFSNANDMKIGVLSDTHCYINPAVKNQLIGCDLILHAGDIGSINVIHQLREISNEVISVCGNNDTAMQWEIPEHKELGKIPQIAEINLPGGSITITHGDEYYSDYGSWHKKLREIYPTAKAIIYGHSHRLVCDQAEDPWILNPGAAGDTRVQKHGVSCLQIHVNLQQWCVEEFRV